ncbi:MAG: SurA N-terminal domain-containing protein [Candidatus Aminicenantes bacterium]
MLKSMRKNLKSLSPALWFVIVAFIISIFAVWGGAGRLGESRAEDTLIKVGNKKISTGEYIETLRMQLQNMQEQFQELNAEFIQQMNIPQQVQEQLIQKAVLLEVADRMGLRVIDEEIRDQIMNLPVFQREGQFVGYDEYERILKWNRIPLATFEEGLREDVLAQKTVDLITAGITVTEDELWEYYKNNNESAKLEYLIIDSAEMELEMEPSDEDLKEYYLSHREKYILPPMREGDYIFLSFQDLKETMEIEESRIEDYYEANQSRFSEPEEITVSRIFISSEKNESPQESIHSLIEELEAGADFGKLAARYSDDDKAEEQGNWGQMEWKRLTPQEQEIIQSLEEGAFSEPLELEDGYSILKVTEKIPAKQLSLDEVRDRIISILKDQKAREYAEETMARLQKEAEKENSLDVAAQKSGYKIKSTGLIKEEDSLDDIDPAGNISRSLFMLEDAGDISPVIQTMRGMSVIQLNKIETSRPAEFEEIKEEVQKDWLLQQKKQRALEKALSIQEEYKNKELETASKQHDLEYQTAEEHMRGQYLSTIGDDPEVDAAAFSLPLQELSQPIEMNDGYVLLRVLDRTEVTEKDFEQNREEVRENLLNTKTNKFFHSFYIQQREQLEVKPNFNLISRINSEILARYSTEQ